MKVEKKEKNRFYDVLWLPTRSYHKILMIWIFSFFKIWWILGIFVCEIFFA
jgi:hypothetical protein